jgi:hypothetical protein
MATKVSFRLRHSSLDLQPIATAIGLPVARIWTAGQPRQTPRGDRLEGVYKESYCAFRVCTNEETIAAAVAAVDAALSAAATSQVALRGNAIRKSLYCTMIDSGETIDVGTLRRLVEWDIYLDLEGPRSQQGSSG